MFASKSTELIRIANRHQSIGGKILAINHTWNMRYGTDKICTHDLRTLEPCIRLENLMDVFTKEEWKCQYETATLIVIEEIQFYKDAVPFIQKALDQDTKHIVAAGLSGDAERKPFGSIPELIPLATEFVQLTALCKYCKNGQSACYTKRIVESKEQTQIGASEMYVPVCHYHYKHQEDKEEA
jgi:thymidine kinase